MREAVIVSSARTPIGKAYRGLFNDTDGPSLGAIAIRAAVERAKVDPAEIDDVIMGSALSQGTTGYNIGRCAALAVTSEPLRWAASTTTVPRVSAAITRFRSTNLLGVG